VVPKDFDKLVRSIHEQLAPLQQHESTINAAGRFLEDSDARHLLDDLASQFTGSFGYKSLAQEMAGLLATDVTIDSGISEFHEFMSPRLDALTGEQLEAGFRNMMNAVNGPSGLKDWGLAASSNLATSAALATDLMKRLVGVPSNQLSSSYMTMAEDLIQILQGNRLGELLADLPMQDILGRTTVALGQRHTQPDRLDEHSYERACVAHIYTRAPEHCHVRP
jgi:hypothetical protein